MLVGVGGCGGVLLPSNIPDKSRNRQVIHFVQEKTKIRLHRPKLIAAH